MRNILKISYRDIRTILKNKIALTIIIGACFIPALYAWFNIAASWDPYGSTKGLKVAVSSDDIGTSILNIEINLGDKIVEELKKNNDIGWIFVDKEQTIQGVKSGEYYAGVVIPEDFSKNFSSILTDDIETPKIDYYVNQKKNAIAPKITDKGVSVVQQQVNEAFLDTAAKGLEGALKVAYEQVYNDEQTIADRILNTLNQVSKSLEQYQHTFKSFDESLNIAKSLSDVFNNNLDTTKNIVKSFDEGINATKKLIDATKLTLPGGKSIAQSGEEIANNLIGLIHSSNQVFTSIADTVSTFLGTSESLANDILNTWKDTSNVNENNIDIVKLQLEFIRKRADRIITVNNNIINILTNINDKLPIRLTIIDDFTNRIKRVNNALKSIIQLTENMETIVNSGNSISDSLRNSMNSQLNQVISDIRSIKNLYASNIKPSIDNEAEKMYKALVDFNLLSKNALGSISQIDTILDGVNDTLHSGKNSIESIIIAIDTMKKSIKSTNDVIISSQKAIQDTNNALKYSIQDLQSLKNKIVDIKKNEKLDKLATILQNDPSVVGKFISAPVQIETISFYEIKNYGSAMTPFYTILSFWVGGVLLVSLLKTKVLEDNDIKNIKPYEAYIGRYFLFMTIGIAQALIVCLGDLFILKIQCINPVLFIIAGIISSIVFINIIYTLVVSFGDVGKAMCVFLLVIQVAGAGGTFPVEITPEFFQKINPYLPFTYAINAMRETIAGLYEDAYTKDILKLLSFLPFSLILGLVLRKPLIKINEFFEEKLEETHIM